MLVVKWGLGSNTEKGIFLSVNSGDRDCGVTTEAGYPVVAGTGENDETGEIFV